jgi:hypothetical protein
MSSTIMARANPPLKHMPTITAGPLPPKYRAPCAVRFERPLAEAFQCGPPQPGLAAPHARTVASPIVHLPCRIHLRAPDSNLSSATCDDAAIAQFTFPETLFGRAVHPEGTAFSL